MQMLYYHKIILSLEILSAQSCFWLNKRISFLFIIFCRLRNIAKIKTSFDKRSFSPNKSGFKIPSRENRCLSFKKKWKNCVLVIFQVYKIRTVLLSRHSQSNQQALRFDKTWVQIIFTSYRKGILLLFWSQIFIQNLNTLVIEN